MTSSNATRERGPALDLALGQQAAARERVLGQHALAERVDGRDRRARRSASAASASRAAASMSRRARGGSRPSAVPSTCRIERADPAHQLGGRPLGERDDQHLVDARVAAHQAIDHQVLDEVRLAGAGRRLDHRGAVARQRRELVGERVAEGRSLPAPGSVEGLEVGFEAPVDDRRGVAIGSAPDRRGRPRPVPGPS